MTPRREQTYFVRIQYDDVDAMRSVSDFVGSIEPKGGELTSVTRERDNFHLYITVVYTAPPGDDVTLPKLS